MKLPSTLILTLTLTYTLFGQQSLTAAELADRAAAFKQPKNYSAGYDQAKNLTSVLFGAREPIKGARLSLYAGSLISISIRFDFTGRVLDRAPDKFNLIFYFFDAPPLGAGKFGNLKLTDQKTTLDVAGGIIGEMSGAGIFGGRKKVQTLTFEMRREDLQTASEMPQLEIELGGRKFRFNRRQRQIFKDIVAVSKI